MKQKQAFIIGDIHGSLDELKELIKDIDREKIRIFSVGDLIDRGKDSRGVINFMRDNNIECVRGNHEEMAAEAISYIRDDDKHKLHATDWYYNGGHHVVNQYDNTEELLTDLEWLAERPLVIKTGIYDSYGLELLISHTYCLNKDIDNIVNVVDFVWDRTNPVFFKNETAYYNVFGHTTTDYMTVAKEPIIPPEPIFFDGAVDIDTGCAYNVPGRGYLTGIHFPSLEVEQVKLGATKEKIKTLIKDLTSEEYTVTALYVAESGSKLHGTSTPDSDIDYKGIVLPNKQKHVFFKEGKQPSSFDLGTNKSDKTPNTKEDVDCDFYTIENFFNSLAKGESNAIELLFSMFSEENIIDQYKPFTTWCKRNYKSLISSNPKSFVGFATGQAKRYNVKGHRYKELVELIDIVDTVIKAMDEPLTIEDPRVKRPLKTHINKTMKWKYIKFTQADSPRGVEGDWTYLEVLGKLYTPGMKVTELMGHLVNMEKSFGNRVKNTDEGIDWKALSHAVRASTSMVELLETGKITYPLANAKDLLAIKLGEIPFDSVMATLETALNQVDLALESTSLNSTVDKELSDEYTNSLYYE